MGVEAETSTLGVRRIGEEIGESKDKVYRILRCIKKGDIEVTEDGKVIDRTEPKGIVERQRAKLERALSRGETSTSKRTQVGGNPQETSSDPLGEVLESDWKIECDKCKGLFKHTFTDEEVYNLIKDGFAYVSCPECKDYAPWDIAQFFPTDHRVFVRLSDVFRGLHPEVKNHQDNEILIYAFHNVAMNDMKFIRNFYEEQSRQGVHPILRTNPPNEVKYMFAKNMMEIKEACLSHKPIVSLDVGCAEGYYTKWLGKFSRYAVGVDISSGYLRWAKSFIKKFNISNVDFVQADAQFLPFREGSIDLVVCFETLEHIPNMKGVVRGISKVLKDDGIFICSTPYDLTDIKPFDNLKELYTTYDKRRYKFYTHIHTFSPLKLISLLKSNDLHPIKISYASKTKKLIRDALKLLPIVGLANRLFYDTEHLFVTSKKLVRNYERFHFF